MFEIPHSGQEWIGDCWDRKSSFLCWPLFTIQRLKPWSGLPSSSPSRPPFQEGPPDPAATGEGEQPLLQPPAKRLHPEPCGHRALPFLPQRGGPARGYGVVQHPQGHQNHVRGEDGVHGPKHVWGVQGPVREGAALHEHTDSPWEGEQYSRGSWGLGGTGGQLRMGLADEACQQGQSKLFLLWIANRELCNHWNYPFFSIFYFF